MKKTLVLLAALALAACQTTPADDAAMGVMNANCPMNPSAKANAEVTSDYDGRKVAFCCTKCKGAFDAMTDAQKTDAVKKVAK